MKHQSCKRKARTPRVKLTQREASNINKNIIRNVISVHLNKRSATGQRRKPQLGAGQYYAGAGATPFVSNPGPQTFSGYSDSFYGLQRQEQTASNIAAVIKREGDQANDSGNGGQPTNNMTRSTPGSQQGRSSISPLVRKSLLMTPINVSPSSTKNPITPTKVSPSSEKNPITSLANKLLTPVKTKPLTPVKTKPRISVNPKPLISVPSDLSPRIRKQTPAGEAAQANRVAKNQKL